MSQLAFNLHGERFEPPADMVFWRVRRLKSGGRGTPEVVYGSDGLPLVLSGEADVEEFRRLVRGAPGRYRLDPVNENQLPCEESSPAYLQLEESERETGGGTAAPARNDELLRAVVAANTEMVRCIAERFATVMDSAATLLRAADGAGMPQREPKPGPAPEVREVAPAAQPVNDDEAEEPLAEILRMALDKAVPLIGHTINTKLLGLSDEQSLALLGGPASPPALPPATEAEELETEPPEESTVNGAITTPVEPPEPATDFVAHLGAIEAELEAGEVALVRKAVGQMKPEALLLWRQRLLQLRPADAAAAIRAEIAKGVGS